MSRQFVVVEFTHESTVSVVHISWIEGTGKVRIAIL